MRNVEILVVALCLAVASANKGLYYLMFHSQERGAACLDGSPPAMYIEEGVEFRKFLIYFEGGGFCGGSSLSNTIEDCYQRSKTSLGSTRYFSPTRTFDKHGLLSSNETENPVFHNWTKVYIIYCDGAVHQGNRQTPISYKGVNLYFRGTKNTMEQFRYMDQMYDFYNAKAIVVTGVSAGGMGTFQWASYLQQNTKTSKVMAIPDSGLFITDFYSDIAGQKILRERISNLLKVVTVDDETFLPPPIQLCLDKPVAMDLVDCYNAANYAEFLVDIPFLVVESTVDAYSLVNIVYASKCFTYESRPANLSSCNDSYMAVIEDYRTETLDYLRAMNKRTSTDISVWAPVCVQHGFSTDPSFTSKNFEVKGTRLVDAVQQFVNGNLNNSPMGSKWLADEQAWPSNKGCAGLTSKGQPTLEGILSQLRPLLRKQILLN